MIFSCGFSYYFYTDKLSIVKVHTYTRTQQLLLKHAMYQITLNRIHDISFYSKPVGLWDHLMKFMTGYET